MIDPEALKVIRRLRRHGFDAYLVGGCVRDLLLGFLPKDFDVITSARPRQVRRLFSNSRVIGRRFRLVHVIFTDKVIEVSTFRADPEIADGALPDASAVPADGGSLPRRDRFEQNNIFGTPAQDARRRDFTINSLFYDPERQEIIDHVGGLQALYEGVLSTNRDPHESFKDDPARIIRAIRFASRLGFQIAPATLEAMCEHRELLAQCSQRRLLEEIFKILASGSAEAFMALVAETGVVDVFLPEVAAYLRGVSLDRLPAAQALVDNAEELSRGGSSAAEVTPAVVEVAEVEEADEVGQRPPRWGMPRQRGRMASFLKMGLIPDPVPTRPGIDGLPITDVPELYEMAFSAELDPTHEVLEAIDEAVVFGRSGDLRSLGRDPAEQLRERQRAMDEYERRLDAEEFAAAAVADRLSETPASPLSDPDAGAGEAGGDEAASSVAEEITDPAPVRVEPAEEEAEPLPEQSPERLAVVMSYLAGLDALVARGKPLTTAFQLTALYASALLHDLDRVEAEGYKGNPEVPLDDFLRPVSVRHSLARRDRDRIKRVSLGMRRLLRGGAGSSRRRRGRSQVRLLSRDYVDESLFLLALHVRATGEGAESLEYWRQRALTERGVDLGVDLDVAMGRETASPEAAELEVEDSDIGPVEERQGCLTPEAESQPSERGD